MAEPMPEEEETRTKLLARLTAYVKSGTHSTSTADEEFMGASLDEAMALVDHRCGTATVPVAVLHLAYIQVGSELYHRRSAPSGISQFAGADGTPIRVARDPMVAAETMLAPFLPLGFA